MKNKVPLIRNSITILMMIIFLSVSGNAQELLASAANVNDQTSTKSLKNILNDLEKKYDVYIVYDSKIVDDVYVTGFNYEGDEVGKVLGKLLISKGLRYERVNDNFYVISKIESKGKKLEKQKTSLLENEAKLTPGKIEAIRRIELQMMKQARNVTGTVTSEDNEALPGVNVLVQGSSVGTVTDLNGKYTISVPESATTLVFSYVGYTSEEVQIGDRSVVDVSLMPDIETLSEIVVVGYGTQERGVVTGAVSTVKMEELRGIPVTNVEQALQGRVAGVTVTQTGGGTPGGAIQVNIRGIGTVNSETPLYVIDGIPVQQSGQNADGYSVLNSLNPNDIESIDILKDASAAAIYGSRASGGVVLISTKRGQSGPARVTFDAYYGTQTQNRFYDVLNADQYVGYLNELHSQPDGQLPPAYQGNYTPPADTDWQQEMFGSAPIQNYNLGVSGGNENSVFSLGLEYFNQEGTMVGTGFERYSIRANSDFKIGKKIKIGETLLLSKTSKDVFTGSGGREPQEHAIKQAPTIPIFDDSFEGGYAWPDTDQGQDAQNPIAIANLNDNVQDRYRAWASLYGEIEILRGFTYKLQVGLDFNYQDNFSYTPRYDGVRRNVSPSSMSVGRSQFISPLLEQFLTYNTSFGKHALTGLLGFSAQSFQFTNRGASGSELPDDVINLQAATQNIVVSYDKNESSLRSLFGRLTYSFDNKYLLTANLRYDESSKLFRGNDPSGIFPSVSAGWRISEEPFMEGVGIISDMKVRVGYGLLGNQGPLSDYPVDVNLIPNFFYVFGNNVAQGVSPNELANQNITWETTRQIDIGLDVGLLDNRLMVNLDYYDRSTEDLIWRAEVPPSVGLGAPFVNGGEVRNNGLEAALTYRKSEGDFQFDIGANLTTINNRVISLLNDDLIIRRGGVTDDITNVSWTRVDGAIGTFYGWEMDGIFRNWDEVYDHAYQNQELRPGATGTTTSDYYAENRTDTIAVNRTAPGDIRWIDQNGDGVINDDDRVALGNPIPDFTYGLNFNGRYKGFDFSIFLQGAHGHEIYNAGKRWLVDFRQNFNNGVEALNATSYRPEYTASEPRLVRNDPNRNVLRSSDRYVYDGSYMRLRNLSVGYSFNNNVLNSLNASKLRVYATAQNLLTITSYEGLEPDVGSLSTGTALDAGIDRLIYPQPVSFIVGVQVGF